MSELHGQTDLRDFLPTEPAEARPMEGYDENGNLMAYHPEAQTSADLPEADGESPRPLEAQNRLNALAAEVRTIEEQVRGAALSGAIAIGRRLVEAKGLVPHGRWEEWLAANLDYSLRRAQDLMRLFETYGRGTIPESVNALDYSKAVALLGAPEEAREALAERAVEEDMSVRQLKDEIKRLNEARKADQLTLEELERRRQEDAETARRAIEAMQMDANTLRGTATAAEQTAEALRKEKQAARDAADVAAKRASDAVQRANEAQAQLTEARQRITELEAREPERVEVVPAEVEAELERLRSQKPRGEAELKFRLAFERLGAEFRAVEKTLAEVTAEDADRGAKFAQAVVTTCRRMIDMLGAEA